MWASNPSASKRGYFVHYTLHQFRPPHSYRFVENVVNASLKPLLLRKLNLPQRVLRYSSVRCVMLF